MRSRVVAMLKVASVAVSVRWYERIGFEVTGESSDDDAGWAEVTCGDLVLQFLSGTPWAAEPAFTGCFYVHTDSVEEAFERIRDVARPEWGVEHRPWGAVELTLQDPDGYFLTFTQQPES